MFVIEFVEYISTHKFLTMFSDRNRAISVRPNINFTTGTMIL